MKETLIIELQNKDAIKLLEDLEQMNIINIISRNRKQKGLSKEEAKNIVGSMPEHRFEEIMSEIDEMKKEWERDI